MTQKQNSDWNKVVMTPAGSGMSVLTSQIVVEQMLAGATVAVVDVGKSSKDMLSDIKKAKNKPYYRQFDKRRF